MLILLILIFKGYLGNLIVNIVPFSPLCDAFIVPPCPVTIISAIESP